MMENTRTEDAAARGRYGLDQACRKVEEWFARNPLPDMADPAPTYTLETETVLSFFALAGRRMAAAGRHDPDSPWPCRGRTIHPFASMYSRRPCSLP